MLQGNDNSMNKLKQILASRYGKGLELRPLTDVSDESLAGAGHSMFKGTDLHIPLRVRDSYLGTAVVPSAEDLSDDSRNQISQMVRMVLEPALYRDYLERRENNLRSLAEEDLDASNLRMFDGDGDGEIAAESIERPKLLSNLVYFHGHDGQRIKRAALLLHEMTGRWAFAPYADMKSNIHEVADLVKLGPLTLYIEDVRSLDQTTQDLLTEYLSIPRSAQCPLILIGGDVPPDDLGSNGPISPAIAAEISINSLELDRIPLTEKSLQEVLKLMFFEESAPS